MNDPVVIASYARTPMASFRGDFAGVSATELGAAAVRAAVDRAKIAPSAVDRLYMGCVLTAGLGQAPARQAGRHAGLPDSVEATTLSKMCGSGMQAAILAAEAISAGTADIIVAGGMENITNAPYVLENYRKGSRAGHSRVSDSLWLDGLDDAYTAGKPMGAFAEETARELSYTREAQDAYAIRSLERARDAIAAGAFVDEIIAVEVRQRGGVRVVAIDEQPGKAKPESIPHLKPAFAKNGTLTAANSSSISDGAAALVLTRRSVALEAGLPIVATVVAHAAHAHDPARFTTAPVYAINKLLAKAGWSVADVDLFEVNEAFAVVAMIAAKELSIPADKLNVHGGATALGHPIGASGARIIVTLLAALRARGLQRGVACLCIGGGEATAMAFAMN